MFLFIKKLLGLGRPLGRARSPQWSALEKSWLVDHPACAACGITHNLSVHHVKPFHLYPELELDPDNLLTLCSEQGNNCHRMLGHGGDFHAWIPTAKHDAAQRLKIIRARLYRRE